ncbi:small acid-soluble spore protein O [Bacillus massiliglaciei]|uniref:small acid-soluble spore protein O n=1 Tax=Bacillus massiliglaciei TaxID=1816693 RepID=UPI000ACCF572|nr:small acid-soluble spore protein O [Bacillus massiliglaciei]
MKKRKANHVIPGMNDAKGQGAGAGYNEEFAGPLNFPLSEEQKQNNKKRKKNQ